MNARHILVGLGEYAPNKAKEISSVIPNSKYFGINEWVYAPEEHSHAIYLRGMKYEDYYGYLLPKVRNWRYMIPSLSHKYNVSYWCRSDIRMIYECRNKAITYGGKEEDIFCKELSDVSECDQIHLIIPVCDRVALAIAFFVGWDIKKYYKKYSFKVPVTSHIILPDTMIYNSGSLTELHFDYVNSCAFIKELVCITEICNGTLNENTYLSNLNFELSSWFNGERDYGRTDNLPFDEIDFVGSKETVDLKDYQLHSKIRNELTDEIIYCINNKNERTISCISKNFMNGLYAKCPIYAPDGRADKAYKLYQSNRKPYSESLHLDWRWDELLINI